MKYINTYRNILSLALLLAALAFNLHAQQREVTDDQRIWVGYMTSTRLNTNYSWWNDFHYVPEGFLVLRTGITRHFNNTAITAGYGHLWLPISANNLSLKRNESRPWAQIQFNLPINNRLSMLQRIRYDARFIQNVQDEQLVNDYTFTNRVRFLTSLKYRIGDISDKKVIPYVVVSDEVLLNFGKSVTWNTFNQNRLSLMLGIQKDNIQIQSGYMNMYIQTGDNQFTQYHTLVIWVFHKFRIKGKARVRSEEIIHN